MSKLTYTDLTEVNLGKLSSAVSDWKSTRDGLKKIMDDADTGMQAKAESARWKGLNATVTKEFVGKTVKEQADLHTEPAASTTCWTAPTAT